MSPMAVYTGLDIPSLTTTNVWSVLAAIEAHRYTALSARITDPACAIVLLTSLAASRHKLQFLELVLAGTQWPESRLEAVACACTTLAYAPGTLVKFLLRLDFETDEPTVISASDVYVILAASLAATHIHYTVFEDVRTNTISSARMPTTIDWSTLESTSQSSSRWL